MSTGLQIGGLETGVRFNFLGGTPPSVWTPAQFPGIIFYGNGDIGGVYTDNPPVTLATAGQSVEVVKALYGTSNNATAITVLQRPLAASGGLKVDNVGTQFLNSTSDIVQSIAAGYTGYAVVNFVNDVVIAGNLTGSAVLYSLGNGALVSISDDGGNAQFLSSGTPFSGKCLIRWDCDASGNGTLDCTGSGGPTSFTGQTTMTINQLCTATSAGQVNADADNQYQLWMLGSQYVARGSSQDVKALAWIQAKTGATL